MNITENPFTMEDAKPVSASRGSKKVKSKRKRVTPIKVKKSAGKKPRALRKDGKPRKAHKFRPGTVSLREIRHYQKSGEPLLPVLPFKRVVREIAQDLTRDSPEGLRFKKSAFEALQAAAEDFLIETLEKSYKGALREGRVTLIDRDLKRLAESQVGGSGTAIILRQAMGV